METIGTRYYADGCNDDVKASIYYGSRSTPDGRHTAYGYWSELLHPHYSGDGDKRSVFYTIEKLGFYRTKEEAIIRLKNESPDISFN
jgi:hypothetical protein